MIVRHSSRTALVFALAAAALAQNTNPSTTRPAADDAPAHLRAEDRRDARRRQKRSRTRSPRPRRRRETGAARARAAHTAADAAQTRAVREAFDSLVDGIRRADAEAVVASTGTRRSSSSSTTTGR